MASLPSLQKVLQNISCTQAGFDQSSLVGRLRIDSRNVQPGDTFVAVEGYTNDGRIYIPTALDNGANLILAEDNNSNEFKQLFEKIAKNKIIWVENLANNLSEIAGNYYDHPSRELKNIAVTGTNGKTSCSYLIAKTLQKMSFECYLMGTLGVGCCGSLKETQNTTADAITLQETLLDALNSGAQFSSMEISSHGLSQYRAEALKLDTAIFTNLTRDHLDYHETMEKYGAAKRQLFLHKGLKNAVLNMDDRFGRQLYKDEEISATKWLVTTQLPTSGANLNRWVWAEDVIYSLNGIYAKVYTPWGSGKLSSPLIGQFNLSNLLLVIAALGSILKDLPVILDGLKNVKSADGRMETLGNENTPLAVVDYSHTPDALEQALMAIREHCVGLIWCVFGCGGDRDPGKRPLMAKIAEKLANRVIVTMDNPRFESSENIKQDIFTGFRKPEKISYIADRTLAIQQAIEKAQPGDAILIAGKGHEEYQIIGKDKIFHSDKKVCLDMFEGDQS